MTKASATLRQTPPLAIVGAVALGGVGLALVSRPPMKLWSARYDSLGTNPVHDALDEYWQSVFTYHATVRADLIQALKLAKVTANVKAPSSTRNMSLIQTEFSALLDQIQDETRCFVASNPVKLARVAAMALHLDLHNHRSVFQLTFHLAGGAFGRVGRGMERGWNAFRSAVGYPVTPQKPKTVDDYLDALYALYKERREASL